MIFNVNVASMAFASPPMSKVALAYCSVDFPVVQASSVEFPEAIFLILVSYQYNDEKSSIPYNLFMV